MLGKDKARETGGELTKRRNNEAQRTQTRKRSEKAKAQESSFHLRERSEGVLRESASSYVLSFRRLGEFEDVQEPARDAPDIGCFGE